MLYEAEHLSPRHWAILAFAWGTWLTGFYSLTVLSFLLPQIEGAFAPSELGLAWLTGIAIGATGVGGIIFGGLSDQLGRRTAIWLAIATFAVGNALSALAPSFGILAAARALAGLGIGGSWGAGQTLIGETFPPARRGRFGALAQSGAPLGLGLAAAVGSFAAPAFGWRAVFGFSTLPILLLVLLRSVPESDIWENHPRRTSILRELVRGPAWSPFWKCGLLTLLNMSNYWFAVVWLPRYLQQAHGLSQARSGAATLVFVCGSLLGYLSFGWLSDRWGRRPAFTLYASLMGTGLLLFTLVWPHVQEWPQAFFLFLFVAGLGTGTWAGYGPMMSELFPTRVRGTALAVIMNATRGVQFLAPVVIAWVAPRWGMGGGIVLAAAFAFACALWIWSLPETRGRQLAAASTTWPRRVSARPASSTSIAVGSGGPRGRTQAVPPPNGFACWRV